jgi:hypothetical protein
MSRPFGPPSNCSCPNYYELDGVGQHDDNCLYAIGDYLEGDDPILVDEKIELPDDDFCPGCFETFIKVGERRAHVCHDLNDPLDVPEDM